MTSRSEFLQPPCLRRRMLCSLAPRCWSGRHPGAGTPAVHRHRPGPRRARRRHVRLVAHGARASPRPAVAIEPDAAGVPPGAAAMVQSMLTGSDGVACPAGGRRGAVQPRRRRRRGRRSPWPSRVAVTAAPATRLDAIALVPAEPGAGAFALGAGWHDVELRHLELAGGASLSGHRPRHPASSSCVAGSVVDDAGTTVEPGGTVLVAGAAQPDEHRRSTGHRRRWRRSVRPLEIAPDVADVALDVSTTADRPRRRHRRRRRPRRPRRRSTSTATDSPMTRRPASARTTTIPTPTTTTLTDGDEVEHLRHRPARPSTPTATSSPTPARSSPTAATRSIRTPTTTGSTTSNRSTGAPARPNPDTDDDGLNDGQEVNDYGSDPHETDSDGDSLGDGDEVNTWGSAIPTDTDSDGDTLDRRRGSATARTPTRPTPTPTATPSTTAPKQATAPTPTTPTTRSVGARGVARRRRGARLGAAATARPAVARTPATRGRSSSPR